MGNRKQSKIDRGRRDALKLIGGGAVTALIGSESSAGAAADTLGSRAPTTRATAPSSRAVAEADADFLYRSGRDPARLQPGILNWHKYDFIDDVNDPVKMARVGPKPQLGFDARGPRPVGGRKFYPYYWAYGEIPAADPFIDRDVKCSGTGSLRLTTQCWTSVPTHRDGDKYVLTDKTDLPSLSANPGGFASINFSNDYSVFVGAGQKVYYQWRERCDDTSMRVKHFGATGWSGPWAVAVNANAITAQTAQNIHVGHYVRLYDANGKIVGNHSIASVAHPAGIGKAPTVITLARNYNPATGTFDLPLAIDPSAARFAYQGPIGPKLMIGTVGDYYAGVAFGQNHVNNQMHWSSYADTNIPIMSQGHTPDPLWQPAGTLRNGSGDWRLQNARACSFASRGNCFVPIPGEWGTRKVCIDLTKSPGVKPYNNGAYYRWPNSAVQVWAGHEGQPLQLVLDWNPSVPGYFALEAAGGYGSYPVTTEQKFGKLNMMNYLSYLDPTMAFPTYHRWYDEIIISREDIPEPAI